MWYEKQFEEELKDLDSVSFLIPLIPDPWGGREVCEALQRGISPSCQEGVKSWLLNGIK